MTRVRRKKTTFSTWLKKQNVTRLSTDLGVTRQTVYSWINKESKPSITSAHQIIKMSNGDLELNDIVKG